MSQTADFEIRDEIHDVNGSARGPVSLYRVSDGRLIHDDTLNLRSAVSRRRFAKAAAEALGDDALAGDVDRLLVEKLDQRLREPKSQPKAPDADALLADTPDDVKSEALAKLRDPDLLLEIGSDLRALGVAGKCDVARGAYVVGVSRLLSDPRAAIVRGASSSGKSFEIATVGRLFPPEAKLEAHHLSAKALFYLDAGALEHKFVIAGERARSQDDEQADATKALREMISDGVLRAVVTE